MANRFSVDPLGGYGPGVLQGLGEGIDKFTQKRDEQEAQVKRQAMFQEASDAYESGDLNKLASFMMNPENAEVGQHYMKVSNFIDEQTAAGSVSAAKDILSGGDYKQIAADRVSAVEAKGGDASFSKSILDMNPAEAKQAALEHLIMSGPAGAASGKAYMEARPGAGGGKLSPVSFKDATADSLAEYERTGDPSKLVRYKGTIKDIAGVPHQYNTVSSLWEPIVDMSGEGISEQVSAMAELEALRQSKLDFTKEQSKWKAGESKLLSSIGTGKAKQKLLENTGAMIKDKLSGWNTSYGAVLSALPGSESRELKGLLNTMKANMAFAALRSIKETGGTLGAISAPELVLLESEAGALDQWSTIEELSRVIDQVIAANQGSLERFDKAFYMDKGKYGSSFEDVKLDAEAKAAVKAGQPSEVTTQAQYDALPSGSIYLEDGKQMRKP